MQSQEKLDALERIGGYQSLQVSEAVRREIERGLENENLDIIEECQKICSQNPDIQNKLHKMEKDKVSVKLKLKIAKLVYVGKRMDLLTDESSPEERAKVERKMQNAFEKIKGLLENVKEEVRSAHVIIVKKYFVEVENEFKLNPKTRKKLSSGLWNAICPMVAGVLLLAAGFGLAAIPAVGIFCSAALFLGLGIWKLVENIQERKVINNYKKFCEEVTQKRV